VETDIGQHMDYDWPTSKSRGTTKGRSNCPSCPKAQKAEKAEQKQKVHLLPFTAILAAV
jgi:hypothetical protein